MPLPADVIHSPQPQLQLQFQLRLVLLLFPNTINIQRNRNQNQKRNQDREKTTWPQRGEKSSLNLVAQSQQVGQLCVCVCVCVYCVGVWASKLTLEIPIWKITALSQSPSTDCSWSYISIERAIYRATWCASDACGEYQELCKMQDKQFNADDIRENFNNN